MPDEDPDSLDDPWSAAVGKIDHLLTNLPDCGRIPAELSERYQRWNYRLGWLVPMDFSDGTRRDLFVLITDDFPYTPPRIALAEPPDILTWPHLEEDGFLCILPTDAAISNEDPVGVVRCLLTEAHQLIEKNIRGTNVEDFRSEFLSYWNRAADNTALDCFSVLEPQGPSRRISIWRGKNKRIVGENPESLTRWLQRWGAKKGKGQDYKLYDGALVWLPEPLLPKEYPNTGADVRTIVQTDSPLALPIIDDLTAAATGTLEVILGSFTPHGACFAAVSVPSPHRVIAPNRKSDPLTKGFRPGHVPKKLLAKRFFTGARKVTKARVERSDHHWIHGRDQDARQQYLRKAHIAILGCGSLGGPLARLLGQAGIGNLLLVDPDTMDWPNVSRHELGVASVNRYKATELTKEIEKALPHLGDISARHVRVGQNAKELMNELASYDLIVSTMGSWAAESFLNNTQRYRDDYPPILYGWVEPNAGAAHAVYVPREGACFRCGTNDKGRPYLTVTEWPNNRGTLQAPACGAIFTPYGPAELCWAHALLTESVVDILTRDSKTTAYHRVWIGSYDRIEAAGGAWSADWIAEMGNPGTGGMTVERQWPASSSCPVCARSSRAA